MRHDRAREDDSSAPPLQAFRELDLKPGRLILNTGAAMATARNDVSDGPGHGEPARGVSPDFGRGVYTLREAARLTTLRSQRVARWVRGYSFATPRGEK